MAITISIISLAIIGFLVFRVNKGTEDDKDKKNLFEYIESLRKEIRESGTESRKETQEKLDRIHDRLSKGLEHSSTTIKS